jgi:hypothetical protein
MPEQAMPCETLISRAHCLLLVSVYLKRSHWTGDCLAFMRVHRKITVSRVRACFIARGDKFGTKRRRAAATRALGDVARAMPT